MVSQNSSAAQIIKQTCCDRQLTNSQVVMYGNHVFSLLLNSDIIE